ncbi:hypothetical protein E4U59_002130 [Claviceps monticola]|nr:hypothetical protein E4U59_002130 [Claviceps monticola]
MSRKQSKAQLEYTTTTTTTTTTHPGERAISKLQRRDKKGTMRTSVLKGLRRREEMEYLGG